MLMFSFKNPALIKAGLISSRGIPPNLNPRAFTKALFQIYARYNFIYPHMMPKNAANNTIKNIIFFAIVIVL